MRNPWLELPTGPPYVLKDDRPLVDAFNRSATRRNRLRTNLLPEPFVGRAKTASVLLLQLNPGFAGPEAQWHRRPDFVNDLRANLAHRRRGYPHLYLDPKWSATPGGLWSRRRLRQLVDVVGDAKQVAREIASVEFHGYHSEGFRPIPVTLPSQHYGFELVRRAVERNAAIVVIRGYDSWTVAVPELRDYPLAFRPKNPQLAYITEGTLGRRAFRTIVDAIGAAGRQ